MRSIPAASRRDRNCAQRKRISICCSCNGTATRARRRAGYTRAGAGFESVNAETAKACTPSRFFIGRRFEFPSRWQ